MKDARIIIPFQSFDIAHIQFEPHIKNRFFNGTFSQMKYAYGPFVIYNPILLPPPFMSIDVWIRQLETDILKTYTKPSLHTQSIVHKKIPPKIREPSIPVGVKISGIWTSDILCGLNYVWVHVRDVELDV